MLQVLERHVECVVPPEELVADHQRGHAEYTLRARPVGVVAQALLDRRVAQSRLRVRDAQLTRELGDHRRIGHVAPLAEYSAKHGAGGASIAACGDDQPQRGERVEGMRRRHAHRQSQLARPPQGKAVREAPLGGNFRRSQLPEVLQQAREQHRHELDAHVGGQARELREGEIRER